jgi:hypothetical protein
MSVDLLRIPEEDWLKALGEGDWLLTLPKDHPDLAVSAAWRRTLADDAACKFVRWVMAGVSVEIVRDDDPPWDCSGSARRYQADPLMLLSRHQTLEEWLTSEYTGNSRASYVSGMGLFWQTYEDDLNETIAEQVSELISDQLKPALQPLDDDGWDEVVEDVFEVEYTLQNVLRLIIGQGTTVDAWRNFEDVVIEQLATERKRQDEEQARLLMMHEQVQVFWRQYCADLEGMRIERPDFKRLNLAERLADVLADSDPQIVEAIAKLGLPGKFSNSVHELIRQIASRALS